MIRKKRHSQPGLSRREFVEAAGGAVLLAGASNALGHEHATQEVQPPSMAYKPLDPAKKVRIGVVGGGFGSAFPWQHHPNCIVAAVADLRADRRKLLSEKFRCDNVYEEFHPMLKDPKVDAVAIFTGAPDHARYCADVMNAGKHVICAVPACHTLEEARLLKETKERTSLKYMMAETSYYYPEGMAARDLYKIGAFGDLFYIEVEYYHPLVDELAKWWYDDQGKPTWRNGYPPFIYPTHGTAFSTGVTRERVVAASALGTCAPRIDRVPPGDNGYTNGKNQYGNPFNVGVMLFKTDRGNIVRCNMFTTGTDEGVRAQWYGTRLSFFMTNRVSGQPSRWWGQGDPKWSKLPDYTQALPPNMRGLSGGHAGAEVFLVNEFISALVEDREPVINIYEALAMGVPGIVAFESALKGGVQLKVPGFDRKV